MSVTPTLFGIDFIKVTQGLRSPLGIAALSACIVLGRRLLRRDPYQIRDVAPIIRNPKVCTNYYPRVTFNFYLLGLAGRQKRKNCRLPSLP
jgi:hypothetical protein